MKRGESTIVTNHTENRDTNGRRSRFSAALHDDYFGVDELRIEDLLALTARQAEAIQFRDVVNVPAGTWERFVNSDELFVIGRLLAINLGRQRDNFRSCLDALRPMDEGSDAWWALIGRLPSVRLAVMIDGLLAQLCILQSVAAVRAKEKIENVIVKSLASEVQVLKLWCATFDSRRSAQLFGQFSGIWWSSNGREPRGGGEEFLWNGFNAFYTAIQHLQDSLRSDFQLSLERQEHDPAVGLMVAFLQLRQKLQARLNTFAARQLDFYYDDILKISARSIVPDRTVLLLKADPGKREIVVPVGTVFIGGADSNQQERRYLSCSDLRVTDASVTELHSFWFERSVGVSPENSLYQPSSIGSTPDQYATSARIQQIQGCDSSASVDTIVRQRMAYAIFGQREANQSGNRGRYANLGIAIASKALAMKQGAREIVVTFEFVEQGDVSSIEAFIDKLSKVLDTTRADAFFKAFRNAFKVSISEEDGWYVFPEYLPTSQCVDLAVTRPNSLGISLQLPPDAGAIVPVDPSIHGSGYADCSQPIIRFELNEAYLFPYSLFAELILARVRIDVNVVGCRDIVAYNQLGRLSVTSQFYPLGATPVVGDYVILGCEETSNKVLTSFDLDIVWAGLPMSDQGFSGHYSGYPTEYGNDTFKVQLSALSDRRWLPSSERDRELINLFDARGKQGVASAGPLSKRRRINMSRLCSYLRPEDNSRRPSLAYDMSTRSGFFKLTLSSPEQGFGHREYPLALSTAVAKSSKKSRLPLIDRFTKKKAVEPLPLAPYTPIIDHLSVDYSACDEIDSRYSSGSGEHATTQIFHIHPLGIEPLRLGRPDGIRLVPLYKEDGHLLIGIEAVALTGSLALFFHLKDDSRPVKEFQTASFSWYYLSNDQWIPLAANRILSDSTDGFLQSGIVALDIPANATANNTICTSGFFWLRVSAAWDDVANICGLYSVQAHAVEVVWQPTDANSAEHLEAGLSAGTINRSKGSLGGISEIVQPINSRGGRGEESRLEKIVRTSERLGHKRRAVTARDYERLVLEEFPDLYQVRCFPCCSGDPKLPFARSSGEVFVVVVPQLKDVSQETSGPMANAHQLNEIRKFITTLNSGVARVRVGNPVYEQIQVRCKVQLKQGQNPGKGVATITRRLAAYLSPWSSERKIETFGWRIRCIDLQAYLQSLQVISLVTGVSVVRISTDSEGRKKLSDTVHDRSDEVLPQVPWSVAVPFVQHLIEVVEDSQAYLPSPAGVGNLAIGTTFIGSREGDD